MGDEFINPNWHVVLMHFPIGLLGAGVLIELIALGWPGRGFRSAGRWMMLLGALGSVPTLLAGLYALRDTVLAAPPDPDQTWADIVRLSSWTSEQWKFMTRHIWLNSFAVGIFSVAAVAGLAVSDFPRTRLHWPLFLLVLVGAGLMGAGAWHGGEAVYRLGTAVVVPGKPATPPATTHEQPGHMAPQETPVQKETETTTTPLIAPGTQPPTTSSAAHEHQATTQPLSASSGHSSAPSSAASHEHAAGEEHEHPSEAASGLTYYVPPLQLHMVLAGVAVAFALAALGLTIRRWYAAPEEYELPYTTTPSRRSVLARPGPHAAEPLEEPATPDNPPYYDPVLDEEYGLPPASPRAFWWLGALCLLLTAVAGTWSFMGGFSSQAWQTNLEELREADHFRVLVHVIFGVSLLLLAVIHAIPPRLGWRFRPLSKIIVFLVLVAVVAQLWLGIVILYDSHTGPLYKFTSAAGQVSESR